MLIAVIYNCSSGAKIALVMMSKVVTFLKIEISALMTQKNFENQVYSQPDLLNS